MTINKIYGLDITMYKCQIRVNLLATAPIQCNHTRQQIIVSHRDPNLQGFTPDLGALMLLFLCTVSVAIDQEI